MEIKVLIVEDNFIIQMFLEGVISEIENTVVEVASSGHEALGLVGEFQPDIVFMDIGLEGEVDGIQVAQILKDINKVPVVFMTGNSDAATLERAKKTEPIHILRKPIDEYQLKSEFKVLAERIGQLKATQTNGV